MPASNIDDLKRQQTAAAIQLSKKRKRILRLLVTETSVNAIREELSAFESQYDDYRAKHDALCLALESTDAISHEVDLFAVHDREAAECRNLFDEWLNQREPTASAALFPAPPLELETLDEVGSSCSTLSSTSARAKEKAALAAFLAERKHLEQRTSLLRRRHELELEETAFKLDVEIDKSLARCRAYDQEDADPSLLITTMACSTPAAAAAAVATTSTAVNSSMAPPANVAPSAAMAPAMPTVETTSPGAFWPSAQPSRPCYSGDSTKLSANLIEFDPLSDQCNNLLTTSTCNYPELKVQSNPARAVSFFDNCPVTPQNCNAPPLAPLSNPLSNSSTDQLLLALSLPKPDLDTFSGDISKYRCFITSFDSRIGSKLMPEHDKLFFLTQYLRGEPRDLIDGCVHIHQGGYEEARRILEREYGDPYKLSLVYVSQITEWPHIKADDSLALRKFASFLSKCLHAMRGADYSQLLEHPTSLIAIVRKLPQYLQNKWREHAHRLSRNSNALFPYLVDFVASAADVANDPIFGKPMSSKENWQSAKCFSTDVKGSIHPLCAFCEKPHDLDDCSAFKAQSIDARRKFLMSKRLCFACYGAGHIANGCTCKRNCDHCGKPHPTAMHVDGFAYGNSLRPRDTSVSQTCSQTQPTENHSTVCSVNSNSARTFHTILPVLVTQKGCTITRKTHCLYDSGSSGCFMSTRLCEEMGLKTTDTRLKMRTMHGTSIEESKAISDLIVSDLRGQNPLALPRAFTRPEIPVYGDSIPSAKVIENYDCMTVVVQNFPDSLSHSHIDLIIGANCPLALEPLQAISDDECPFVAVKFRHGWTFYGSVVGSDSDLVCHQVNVMEIPAEVSSRQCTMTMPGMDFSKRLFCPDERRRLSRETERKMNDGRKTNRIVEGRLPFDDARPVVSHRFVLQRKGMVHDANNDSLPMNAPFVARKSRLAPKRNPNSWKCRAPRKPTAAKRTVTWTATRSREWCRRSCEKCMLLQPSQSFNRRFIVK